MSLPAEFLSEEQLSCSICLDIFTNPVSTPCGHSFCLTCITSYWEGQSKICLCPLCKENFRKRPELHINHTLKEITEQFKRMAETSVSPRNALGDSLAAPFSPLKLAGQSRPPEYSEQLMKEIKSRFQRSTSSELLSSQQPSAASDDAPPPGMARCYSVSGTNEGGSGGQQCPKHRQCLELFCKTDQSCICTVCAETEHQGHSVGPAKREMNIKKSQLRIMEVELQGLITVREKKIEEIQASLIEIQTIADQEIAGTVSTFGELMSAVERSQAELLEVVEMGRRAAELRSQAFIRDLEMEIANLRKRSGNLSQLVQSQDHFTFFKTYPANSSLPAMKNWADVALTPDPTAGAVLKNVTQVVRQIQESMKKLPETCLHTENSLESKLWRLQEYAMDVTLDRDSAHPRLIISEDGKQVRCSDRYQNVPDTSERFDRVVCVLGRPGFNSGRHYWVVQVGEKTDWDLGVASHFINRKGKIAANPANGFWFLSLRDKHEYIFRAEQSTTISLQQKPQTIGVFVDYEKGQVSFYNADTRSLIFTFTGTFASVLYPFFSPCTNKSSKNEAPLIICPAGSAERSWLTEK
ncbi:E3 ubiquitin-protein ligase TRIM7 isoform X2 [Triplophysa rosa]|uniref:E3 ubiquitin-protein ligase TRIM21 n=2 Tax=Triplophysa rosa TaxID=992332 RepID=A0A9W7WZI4_TRIRA|nr:E3 ubiquitin-protein ligase TRIM7 isoform X2 [Triplophysa rosa]XP_057188498.1 E3 ubiquitin-protein ligase TRIM7 isoform X2 [Triplophysa rosa]KAI7810993.1 putative E3 ubiquitin-protein ligase TRIM21 [Triplophysa rosa]